jgi:transglutaminase-like putative cysteine protease
VDVTEDAMKLARPWIAQVATLLFAFSSPALTSLPIHGARTFEATYVGTIGPLPSGAKRAEVWIPLPSDTPYQEIRDLKISSPVPVTLGKDSVGNAVAHFVLEDAASLGGKETDVRVTYRIRRAEVRVPLARATSVVPGKVPPEVEAYLGENRMIPLTPRVRRLAAELSAGRRDVVEKAQAFYSYLVENGTYDKTTPGWGKGDSERFCNLKKGNCTDFHSAFMALARAEGIPVRFVIGFPLKPESAGTVTGYHCWAEFWAEGAGWIPIDASDAAKSRDKEKKRYLFGNLDPDRFEISRGRDLTLSPKQKGEPINFFIYPYVEVDGKPFAETKTRVEYKDA